MAADQDGVQAALRSLGPRLVDMNRVITKPQNMPENRERWAGSSPLIATWGCPRAGVHPLASLCSLRGQSTEDKH
eukprot:3763620-Amphidinium_carterae.1